MIKLTQLNNVEFVVNCDHIECIQSIPESKVILNNKTFFIVLESPDEIIQKVLNYHISIMRNGKDYIK